MIQKMEDALIGVKKDTNALQFNLSLGHVCRTVRLAKDSWPSYGFPTLVGMKSVDWGRMRIRDGKPCMQGRVAHGVWQGGHVSGSGNQEICRHWKGPAEGFEQPWPSGFMEGWKGGGVRAAQATGKRLPFFVELLFLSEYVCKGKSSFTMREGSVPTPLGDFAGLGAPQEAEDALHRLRR